jgi:hypothetical protein
MTEEKLQYFRNGSKAPFGRSSGCFRFVPESKRRAFDTPFGHTILLEYFADRPR